MKILFCLIRSHIYILLPLLNFKKPKPISPCTFQQFYTPRRTEKQDLSSYGNEPLRLHPVLHLSMLLVFILKNTKTHVSFMIFTPKYVQSMPEAERKEKFWYSAPHHTPITRVYDLENKGWPHPYKGQNICYKFCNYDACFKPGYLHYFPRKEILDPRRCHRFRSRNQAIL